MQDGKLMDEKQTLLLAVKMRGKWKKIILDLKALLEKYHEYFFGKCMLKKRDNLRGNFLKYCHKVLK